MATDPSGNPEELIVDLVTEHAPEHAATDVRHDAVADQSAVRVVLVGRDLNEAPCGPQIVRPLPVESEAEVTPVVIVGEPQVILRAHQPNRVAKTHHALARPMRNNARIVEGWEHLGVRVVVTDRVPSFVGRSVDDLPSVAPDQSELTALTGGGAANQSALSETL